LLDLISLYPTYILLAHPRHSGVTLVIPALPRKGNPGAPTVTRATAAEKLLSLCSGFRRYNSCYTIFGPCIIPKIRDSTRSPCNWTAPGFGEPMYVRMAYAWEPGQE